MGPRGPKGQWIPRADPAPRDPIPWDPMGTTLGNPWSLIISILIKIMPMQLIYDQFYASRIRLVQFQRIWMVLCLSTFSKFAIGFQWVSNRYRNLWLTVDIDSSTLYVIYIQTQQHISEKTIRNPFIKWWRCHFLQSPALIQLGSVIIQKESSQRFHTNTQANKTT